MKNNIIFLDCTSNYPYQFSATNTKVEFMAKGLNESGCFCTIHNGIIGYSAIKERICINIEELGKVITYPRKGNQLISWLFNIKQLYKDLKKAHNKKQKNIIILEFPDYHIYLLYIFIAKRLGYKTITISHEWGLTISSIHILRKPFVWLYSKTFGFLTDGILPISEYIVQKTSHFHTPSMKLPIIADFTKVPQTSNSKKSFFLYCVYAAYKRVITDIIDAYSIFLAKGGQHQLVLVLAGNEMQIQVIRQYIYNKKIETKILIKSKVPYKELIALYHQAAALIIPLNPYHEQDKARFSQKIAEYLSSGSPIISNYVGEIKYYFKNKKNIILCDYSIQGFVAALEWVSKHPKEAQNIGYNGYLLGKNEFNYQTFGRKLHSFINSL
ncbi:glycosyltransferase [Bacteroides clarus]|uniref:Glycosyl transferase family 1 domain-containing protein n=1 Tax=Bacteroides clarus TaxID=626929 RepID=A0A1Y3YPX5_9BACE|nr:glycosyltransferase [Bacteroides clarus]OUN99902.1 hypothetical protein B5F97_15040 [Bacteroides clarus]